MANSNKHFEPIVEEVVPVEEEPVMKELEIIPEEPLEEI